MAYSFRQDLFEVNGDALWFDVSSCYDAEELESIIDFGGGRTDKREGQYTISFHTRNSPGVSHFNPPRDLYCSDFILKCCAMNTILPLRKYLLKESMFTSDFDPNDILLQKLTWKDAQSLFARRNITEIKKFKSPAGCLTINGMVPVVKLEMTNDTSNCRKNDQSKCFRHEFTPNDKQQIIDFFVANPNFDISNSSFWQSMAEGFPVHTWQSLKNHFRNKIYPYLEQYKLDDELVDKMRTQIESKKRSLIKSTRRIKVNESDSDSDSSLPQQKRRFKKVVILDEESSDESSPIEIDEREHEQEEEHVSGMKTMEDISIQCDYDEATVTDSFVQTNPVEILPLPDGFDYPTTFADAIELMRSTISSKKHVQRPSPEKVGAPPTRRNKPTPSKAESMRRSPRKSVVRQPKKTRSGSLF